MGRISPRFLASVHPAGIAHAEALRDGLAYLASCDGGLVIYHAARLSSAKSEWRGYP